MLSKCILSSFVSFIKAFSPGVPVAPYEADCLGVGTGHGIVGAFSLVRLRT